MKRVFAASMLTLALAFAGVCHVRAATPVDTRRDELAKLQETLGDPDPLVRLTNMEAAIDSGDALKIQIALRPAFSGDDAGMRAIGMRAYLESIKELALDIVLPPAVQKQYDSALNDQNAMKQLLSAHEYLLHLSSIGFRVRLVFKDYKMSESTGVVVGYTPGTFSIVGDRLSIGVPISALGLFHCDFDVRPTRALTLDGTMACDFGPGVPRLGATAAMF
jgi:hypothetical protein